MSSLILTIDNAIDNLEIIDQLYELLVRENITIPVTPPNFIFKDDLDCRSDLSDLDNLLREIIWEIWMNKAHFLIKDRMDELVGFECWNNNLPNDVDQVKALAGGMSGLNYHLDKDEAVFAQRGEIHLPMFATAFYIGPKEGLNGGELMVNVRPEHYEEYEGGLIDLKDDENWVKIPYRYNRMTIFDSSYPHFVMPIIATPSNEKRCSIAINAWHREIGT